MKSVPLALYLVAILTFAVLVGCDEDDQLTGPQVAGKGDINLDGLRAQLSDAAMFRQFLIHGSAALGSSSGQEYVESDLSRDGVAFGVDDYIFLSHVIVYGKPYLAQAPKPRDTVLSWWFRNDGSLYVPGDLNVGVLRVLVSGSVTPSLRDSTHWYIESAYSGGTTKIVVSPDLTGDKIHALPDLLLSGLDSTFIIHVRAATVEGAVINFVRTFP